MCDTATPVGSPLRTTRRGTPTTDKAGLVLHLETVLICSDLFPSLEEINPMSKHEKTDHKDLPKPVALTPEEVQQVAAAAAAALPALIPDRPPILKGIPPAEVT
jgi:hypothetical protein